jgi:hypothetical protein
MGWSGHMPRWESFKVSLNLGAIKLEGTWKPDERERKAAWEMYVEIVTRISIQKLCTGEGLLNEALSSLYTLFDTTRKIMRTYGPSIAQPKKDGTVSFGILAVTILNHSLRPLLTKWHPLLLSYEQTRKENVTQVEHERKWDLYDDLCKEINKVREELRNYASILADVANVPYLHK